MVRTAILTIGDEAAGSAAAAAMREVLGRGPFTEVDYLSVPDEQAIIRAKLRLWADGDDVDLVLTSGGVGLSLKDRAPEATRQVLERDLPGLPELMRAVAVARDPGAALTRAVAGVRRSTVIVNLPGGATAAREALGAVLELLPRAVQALADPAAPPAG